MDQQTRQVYERGARAWIAARAPAAIADGRLPAFARRVRRGGLVADLGCGPGWYAQALRERGLRVCALDVSESMLGAVPEHAPGVPRVCGDLEALPFAFASLDGAWAMNTYCHLPAAGIAVALADLHAALRPGGAVELTLPRLDAFAASRDDESAQRHGDGEQRSAWPEMPGRLFLAVTPQRARALLEGAGFASIRVREHAGGFWLCLTARRARTLPDLVRPGLRLLICGLNPSLLSADCGIPFARAGNRFWGAAVAAGLVERERDPRAALHSGVGFTDIVKRASAGASELLPQEYRRGMKRLEAVVRRYQPGATCFVGLDGWRSAVDRRAVAGWVEGGFAGRPAYLMPSTSGRNARVPPAALAAHLRAALDRGRPARNGSEGPVSLGAR